MSAVLTTFSNFTKTDWSTLAQEGVSSVPGGALAVFGTSLGLAYVLKYVFSKKDKFAPGPYVPFFGNALEIPTQYTWRYFAKLSEKYGPMIRLTIAGGEMLVLNKLEDIDEILVKRSGNYSSRKPLIYAGKYRSGDKRLVLLPYGPLLKKQRAAFFQMLNAKMVGGYEHIQERGTMKLLAKLTGDQTGAYLSIKNYAAETLLNLVYAKAFGSDGKDLRTLLGILESFVTDMHPRAYLVDTFPVLDYLPDALAPWRQKAKKMHAVEVEFYTRLLMEVKGRMDKGENLECFAARLWEDNEKNQLDLTTLAYVAGSAFEAGTDNTAGTILWFLVAGLLNPHTLKKAQEEIDRVVGADGYAAPTFQHLDQLPYCVALIKETFRWMPVAPVSAPHHSLKEDEYKGYRIPANTTVISNIWAVHHDDSLYPDPFTFNPDRFYKPDAKLRAESLNEEHYGFGFGRRTCPGQYLASKSVFIAAVRLLWAFNIEPPVDASGKPILPDPARCRNGLTAEPDTFGVVMKPRSDIHVQTIKQVWSDPTSA
ncbi:cytochrome P450 [Exidia glandulosa HHB12029]|uniref:Cytochrome P450 n=1 Tax=Exidia glandulosa HHB12029 TaxID=1314781 RepID=A0A165DSR3_EXIGL|nr:cytochrome P450 [Exidia glandulosa HHB12029]